MAVISTVADMVGLLGFVDDVSLVRLGQRSRP
jgi:uncharacterized membrane protein YkvA (DUF1232 family)